MALGAIHHPRRIAKALYALKIYLFRDQFRLTSHETRGVRDFCVFVVRLYVLGSLLLTPSLLLTMILSFCKV